MPSQACLWNGDRSSDKETGRNWHSKGSWSMLGTQSSAFIISDGQEGAEEPSSQLSDEREVETQEGEMVEGINFVKAAQLKVTL